MFTHTTVTIIMVGRNRALLVPGEIHWFVQGLTTYRSKVHKNVLVNVFGFFFPPHSTFAVFLW